MAIKILCSVQDTVKSEFHPPLACSNRADVYRSFMQAMEQVPSQFRNQYHLYLVGHQFSSTGKIYSQDVPVFICSGDTVTNIFNEYLQKLSISGPDPMFSDSVIQTEEFRNDYLRDTNMLPQFIKSHVDNKFQEPL